MKKVYWASLCYEGAHGGGLYLLQDRLIFKTNKVQLPDSVKNINIPYSQIHHVSKVRVLLLFPAIEIVLQSHIKYKFIVFFQNNIVNNLNAVLSNSPT